MPADEPHTPVSAGDISSAYEHDYDILDIFRVIRRAWVFVLGVPIAAACVTGLWAFPLSKDQHSAQMVIGMPAEAVKTRDVAKEILAIAAKSNIDSDTLSVTTSEIANEFGPSYRTVKVIVDDKSPDVARFILEEAIESISSFVDEYDIKVDARQATLEKRQGRIEKLLDDLSRTPAPAQDATAVAAVAAATASLTSVLFDLDEATAQLAKQVRGPLKVVSPVELTEPQSNMRWLRFPIVAGLAGLIAVLLVAFVLDGIRLASARRLRKP